MITPSLASRSLKSTPTESTHPGLRKGAWLGDALLLLNLRHTCLLRKGELDDDWVSAHSSNAFQAQYLCDVGYDCARTGLSVHKCGDAFEYLYHSDRGFAQKFNAKYGVVPFGAPTPVAPVKRLSRCWVRLFSCEVPSVEPLAGEEWLSRAQLLRLSAKYPFSEGLVGVEKDGNYWHIIDGDSTVDAVVRSMSSEDRVGGRKERPASNLSPFGSGGFLKTTPNPQKVRAPAHERRRSWGGEPRVLSRPQHNPARPKSSAGLPRGLELGEDVVAEEERVRSWFVREGERLRGQFGDTSGLRFSRESLSEPVGGLTDCWKKCFQLKRDDAAPLTLLQFVSALVDAIAATLGPKCDEAPVFELGPVCFICLEPNPCGCGATVPELTSPFYDAMKDYKLKLSLTEQGFHLEGYRWKSASRRNTVGYMSLGALVEGVLSVESWTSGLVGSSKVTNSRFLADTLVGLTTAVVMGTIGDCEPTLDVVATNYFAAKMEEEAEVSPPKEFSFVVGDGHGWMASDFFGVHDPLAKALFDEFGSQKGSLELSERLWNECCHLWGGQPVNHCPTSSMPGSFVVELSEQPGLLKVPAREVGPHKRVMPEDFVLVTHPDHVERFSSEGWETQSLPLSSKDFIALGQAIMEKGAWGLQEMKAMHETLFEHIKAAMPICEQSDLIYLVSGTTFHYFLASVFPEKQVFEVCPVPREDNGVCPEFYLGHYLEAVSLDPHFGFEVGRLYNKWLTAPKYLAGLEWSGEFKYREPPKYHAIPPWAADKWKISSPSVGFKPYGDFVRKSQWVERETISAYFSLGSCESLLPSTQRAVQWLKTLPVRWTVDSRWVSLFEDVDHVVASFFRHEEGLSNFDWVVHHGGAGVTFTCCALGVPQSILPQIGDQFLWRKALEKSLVPFHIEESELRAQLFHDRFPAKPCGAWAKAVLDGPSWWITALTENGATPVVPFRIVNHCCHDQDTYGRKASDLVVGQSKDWWFTIFNSGWEVPGKVDLTLKFVRKECKNTGSRLTAWMGFPLTQTYPEHAHGWLTTRELFETTTHMKAMPASCVSVNSSELVSSLTARNLASRSVHNACVKMHPRNVDCACGGRGYDMGGVCERCALKHLTDGKLDPSLFGGYAQTLYGGFKPRLKPYRKTVTFRMAPGAFGVQSRKRYYQLDSRVVSTAKNPVVARALLDQVPDLSANLPVEAFWEYTHTKPPHYQWKTSARARTAAIAAAVDMFGSVSMETLGRQVLEALGAVLSVGSAKAVWGRLDVSLLRRGGRDLFKTRWWVIVDGLRHFNELTKRFGIDVMPEFAGRFFPPLEEAKVRSVIPYRFAIATALRSRAGSSLWFDSLRSGCTPLKVHLFSLRLPALGTKFGVFHAVVEYDGRFWELQQTSRERCHINVTRWAPEASPARPLVKTVLVEAPVCGSLPERLLCRQLEQMEYKVLGENCLVFANLLVYLLTGKVIPWRHFGAFGRDFPLQPQKELSDWASSFFFLGADEERLQVKDGRATNLVHLPGGVVQGWKTWVGPKVFVRDYGLRAVQRVEAVLEAYSDDPDIELPYERDHMLDFLEFAVSRFHLTGAIVARAVLTRRVRRIPTSVRKWRFLNHLLVLFRQAKDVRIVADGLGVITATSNLRGALRTGKKVGWTPILNISVPRHWFRSGERLVEVQRLPENLNMQPKVVTKLDLPQIRARYAHYFEGVEMPKVGFKFVKPGEYEIGVKVPIRTKLPEMDKFSAALIRDLQEIHPFELGVFSLRFGTTEMAEKVTDRYFSGSFAPGQLISERDQEELAQAIFENENHLYRDTQLISPEEVWKKWHRNYSAGFPFRFNSEGRASRQKLVDAVGGKAAFLEAVRRYIESPEAFPTVSHAFIKDEVLPRSYVEREKIRTIIAQDPLNYYLAMAVQGDASKRLDPTSFSAVGVSASHGEMVALAEQHLAYRHHTAMDVTAMDSTAAVDAVGVLKKLRKLGFARHPQREAVETAVDATYDNLVASWIIDIHTGRARLKKQGLSTGHASTTPSNTEYMRVLMLYAWKEVTGRPYKDFYECVKFSSFSDDNYWSTNLPPSVFSGEKVSEFWLSRGVQVRVEGASDDLSQLSFLSKKFSFDPEHLAEVRSLTGVETKVAIVHDATRLLQKFSDYKKKNTLRYRWEKFAALQLNCAHLPEIHNKVGEYLDVMEKELSKRASGRKFLKQHPRKSYEEVMALAYVPGKHQHSGLVVTTLETSSVWDKVTDWWDTLRADIMTFDSTANSVGRIASQFAGLLEIGGLNIEDPGLFLKGPGELAHDDEYTLEHHLYLLSGCPESFEKLQVLASKSPFSVFMDLAGFWSRREYFDTSEEMANGLRLKVTLLLAIYTLVAWLEQSLMAVPVIGPMYRLLATAKHLSEKLYSRLNSLYYAAFGDSSAVISAMMPKDRFLSLKVIAHRMWCVLTPSDVYNFSGGVDNFQEWVDAVIKFGQDIHQVSLDFDISPFLPVPGTGERNKDGVKKQWSALDHSDSVRTAVELLESGKVPLVTGPTGAGKSTDFIVSLQGHFETVIVACPRVSIVQANPVAQTKLFAGCSDSVTRGYLNFGTAGYLRRVLADLPPNTVVVLDEFHELDEDTLWLLDRYRGQVLAVTATPKFYGAERFVEVGLTKSRVGQFSVTSELLETPAKLEDAWGATLKWYDKPERVLVILPTVSDVETCLRHAAQLAPKKRVCGVYRGKSEIVEADWYFATSIVDAGVTIPGVQVVIDTGWSMGWKNGRFERRPSSHNISAQRRGRTGRTCNGHYVRLHSKYDDSAWDFSTPFLVNCHATAKKWSAGYKRPKPKKPGGLESIPSGHEEFFARSDWPAVLYTVFLYENRLNVNKAREAYQSCRKFPEARQFRHLTARIENFALDDLFQVESRLRESRLPGEAGNFWNWDATQSVLVDFREPVPRHLQDTDE